MLAFEEVGVSRALKLHRMGINQTETFREIYYGNEKIVELAKIDALKERIQNGAFYLSEKGNEYLIVDMYAGHVYKMDKEKYTLVADDEEDNILVIDSFLDTEKFLIEDGVLNFEGLSYFGISNYTKLSRNMKRGFEGYDGVRFNNSFRDSIKVHTLVALMDYGIEIVANCVGVCRTHDIHHIESYKRTRDNSIMNLSVMTKESHQRLHGYFWRDKNVDNVY